VFVRVGFLRHQVSSLYINRGEVGVSHGVFRLILTFLYLLPCWCDVEQESVVSARFTVTLIILLLSIQQYLVIHPLF
jgi:hypothetical protein